MRRLASFASRNPVAAPAAPAAPAASAAFAAWWILRVAAGMCFIGHGVFGLITKEEWVPFFGIVGISRDAAYTLMPLVGGIDIALGVAVLLRPRRAFLLYMAVWALWTAALRPLSGQSIFELLERAGNYGVPIAMLLLLGPARAWRDWVAAPVLPALDPERTALIRRVLAWTTALLLFGHGALGAFGGKALLGMQVAAIGLPVAGAAAAGWAEIVVAVLVLVRPRPALLVAVALWKVSTEMLYPITGAPVWEFIERGGSYGAPLGLAVLLAQSPSPAAATAPVTVTRLAAALLLLAAWPAGAQDVMPSDSLVAALRRGGYVVACRHAVTDHEATDRGPDRASQRNLTEEGVGQAQAMGAAIRALGIPIGEVRANPMYRNRETAEHAFGRATVDSTLGSEGPRTAVEAAAALRVMLGAPVPGGSNRAIVTRIGILNGAFQGHGVGLIDEGDCIIAQPTGDGTFRVVRHLKAGDWARLLP